MVLNLHPHLIDAPVVVADGKCMACTYRVKFIELSVGINHNVDDRSTGGHSESDTTEERAGERGEQGGERRYGGWRALVQIQGRGACQHESEANVDLAVRQGGQQVQELREPSRALNQEGRSLGCT